MGKLPTTALPGAKRVYRLELILAAVIASILLLTRTDFLSLCDRVIQTNPLSGQRALEQPFTPTNSELACLHGDATRSNVTVIPNVVHFIYIPTSGAFTFINYLSVRSAMVSLSPTAIFIHYSYVIDPVSSDRFEDPFANPWLRRLRPHVHLVHHAALKRLGSEEILRLQVMRELGGVYMDLDVLALRPFTGLMNPPRGKDVVLGSEGGNRGALSMSITATRPQSAFISRLLRMHEEGQAPMPRNLDEALPGKVCEVAPGAFFWPTWTWNHVEWMHKELDAAEASRYQEELDSSGGALLEGQLAYRAWSDAARRHLGSLTPDVVRTADTRFNILARRFLEEK